MKKSVVSLILILGLALIESVSQVVSAGTQQVVKPAGQTVWIENAGQFPQSAMFYTQSGRLVYWLVEDGFWISFLGPEQNAHVKITFQQANPDLRIEPSGRSNSQIHYLLGDVPANWHTNVPAWSSVRYQQVFPGIDLSFTIHHGQVLPELICLSSCGTALQDLRITVAGARDVILHNDELQVITEAGSFRLPLWSTSITAPIEQQSELLRLGESTFQVTRPFASQDHLPQEPTGYPGGSRSNGFSGLLSGSSYDQARGIAVDRWGNTYVAGHTYSVDFPTTPGSFTPDLQGDSDAFVAKISPNGTAILYATFFGGAEMEQVEEVAVDRHGSVYLTGDTASTDFPVTPGAWITSGEDRNGYVTKLSFDGTSLIYSTLLPEGSGAKSITVDRWGYAFLTGKTDGSLPTTPGAFDSTYAGNGDAFAIRMNPTGTAPVYATYLGGSGSECYDYCDIAIDQRGAAYITGETDSAEFPVTPGVFDPLFDGPESFFLVKLNREGTSLIYSTFIEFGLPYALAVDRLGAAYLAGTARPGFSATPGAFAETYRGEMDGFIAKVNPAATGLVYATFIGGSQTDDVFDIAVDPFGRAAITGYTTSPDFPTTPGAFSEQFTGGGYLNSDAYILQLDASGSSLVYSSFLGGSELELGWAVTTDRWGQLYVTGETESPDFPTTGGAFNQTFGGLSDSFVMKFIGEPFIRGDAALTELDLGEADMIYLPLVAR